MRVWFSAKAGNMHGVLNTALSQKISNAYVCSAAAVSLRQARFRIGLACRRLTVEPFARAQRAALSTNV
jgi:hypothetical protein